MNAVRWLRGALLAGVLGIAAGCQSVAQGAHRVEAVEALVPVTIEGAAGSHVYQVEVARTVAEQARGLMFRTSLAPDRGMLFPFSPARRASFWMKNTLIPLDIVFIRPDGRIARIAAQATPLSLEPIDSGTAVAAVLEIAGGGAAAAGLRAGDRVWWRGGPHGRDRGD